MNIYEKKFEQLLKIPKSTDPIDKEWGTEKDYSINIPLLDAIRPDCLVVDDVYETGKTLNQVLEVPHTTTFVWYSKVQPQWWNAIEITHPDEWLVFPWENRDRAAEDMKAYQSSRNRSDD